MKRREMLYAGAAGRTTIEKAARLGRGWAVVPKFDGSYLTVTTDGKGRIRTLVTRGGQILPLEKGLGADFAGIRWAPDSVLIGEAEIWTEAANRIAACRGHRNIVLFDALRVAGRDVSSLAYQGRRDALMRAESELVQDDIDKPWIEDLGGRAHHPGTGQYVRPVPRSWRRMPVAPSMPAHRADAAWSEWVAPGREPVEGLVVVALGARIGQRGAARKIKIAETIDAVVVGAGHPTFVRLGWAGGTFVQYWTRACELTVGQVVEVACQGFQEASGLPKYSRIVRIRNDLSRDKMSPCQR